VRQASAPVTVVGGSATGLFAAIRLAEGGRAVTLLEGADSWEPEPRTLIVTRRMRDLLGDPGDRAIVNTINRFELITDGRVATVSLTQPDLIIERSVLVRGLVEQAVAAGVDVRMGQRLQTLRPGGSGVILEVGRPGATEELVANTVVGADGTFSRVARDAGWPPLTTVSLIQAIVKLPPDLPHDTTRVWFHPNDTPYFYWLIPESSTHGALGLIGEDGPGTRHCLERFLEHHHLEPILFQAARVPCYSRWVPTKRRMGDADIYLVGDAAAHVKVTTVGGIVTGFRGALGVAETILHGRSSGALRRLRWELDWHLLMRRSLSRFNQDDYGVLLDALTPGAKGVLSAHTRDEPGRVLLRLCLAQPRLIWLALRTLVLRSARPSMS
jgi:flavin-dependent dehydrogenase